MSALFCSLWLVIGDQLGTKVKAKLVSASNKEPYLEVMGLIWLCIVSRPTSSHKTEVKPNGG